MKFIKLKKKDAQREHRLSKATGLFQSGKEKKKRKEDD